MDDLRSEIRAAFDKEQAAHPPASNLRWNIARSAAVRPRRETQMQWLAVVAALVIGALVVATLMSTRYGNRGVEPAATPKATPVTPERDYGPPPAGVPLLYVRDPNHATWLIGFDWQGQPRGTVKFALTQADVQMSPDGQLFVASQGGKGGTGDYFDRLGQSVPSQAGIPGFAGALWADDNKHRCGLGFDATTYEWTLYTQLPGEAPQRVGVVAKDSSIGQTSVTVNACSLALGRAILVRTSIAWPSEVWVMDLATGRSVSHDYTTGTLSSIVASPDGGYIAENSAIQTQPSTETNIATQIRRTSDWAVVTSLGSQQVIAFSRDDSRALVTPSQTFSMHVAVLRLSTGETLWRYAGTEEFGGFTAQPDGSSFAVAVTDCVGATCSSGEPNTRRHIVIVHPDGTTIQIPGRYATVW